MAISTGSPFKIVLAQSTLPVNKEEGAVYVWKNGLYLATSTSSVSMLGQVENVASLASVTNPIAERYYVDTTAGTLNRWTGTAWQTIGGNGGGGTGTLTAHSFSITGKATAEAVSFDGTADVALSVTALDATGLTGAIPDGVTAVTQSANDNSTKLATTAYVDAGLTSVRSSMSSAMHYRGTVDQVESDATHTGLDDPYANTDNTGTYIPTNGDVWNVADTGDNYAYSSADSQWDKLSGTVDLSNLVTLDGTQTITGTKTFSQTIVGNASTATALATGRMINVSNDGITATGQSFDGSADVTIPITFVTQSANDNSTKPATTAYVDAAVSNASISWEVIE